MNKSFCLLLGSLLALGTAQARVEVQHWNAASGARVFFVESRGLPILDVSVEFAAGSGHDPPGKAGVARLTQVLVKAGSAQISEAEIGRRLGDVGAIPADVFDRDRAGFILRTLSSPPERERALATLAEMIQAPAFPAAAFEREKARLSARSREAETRPGELAERRFYALSYAGHSYGASPTADSVAAISAEDVARFYGDHYTAENAVVTIVGDGSGDDARRIAEQLTSRLQRGRTMALAPLAAPGTANTLRVPLRSEQAHILLGLPALRRTDPDYFPLFVGNFVLGGGGFVSRLYREVRDERGFAYSVHSYFLPLERPGPFLVALQTRTDQADEALAHTRRVVGDFLAKGPTARELALAKNALVGGFSLRVDSNRKILDQVALMAFYRLAPDWLDEFVSNVRKVTLEQIREAFARHVDPARLVMVIVGGP